MRAVVLANAPQETLDVGTIGGCRNCRHNSVVVVRSVPLAGLGGCFVLGKYWAYAIILCCLASPARAAGIQLLDSDPGLAGAIWYPCAGEPKHVALGNIAPPVDIGL